MRGVVLVASSGGRGRSDLLAHSFLDQVQPRLSLLLPPLWVLLLLHGRRLPAGLLRMRGRPMRSRGWLGLLLWPTLRRDAGLLWRMCIRLRIFMQRWLVVLERPSLVVADWRARVFQAAHKIEEVVVPVEEVIV